MTNENHVMADSDEFSLLDVAHTVAANWRLLLLGPMVAGALAIGVTFLLPPSYVAVTKFLPPQQQQSAASAMLQNLGALSSLAGTSTGLKNPSDQYIAFLRSRTVQDALVDRFKLKDRYELELREDAATALSKISGISSGKDGIITIQVSDEIPAFAAELANAYVSELGRLLDRLAVTEAQQRRQFFEKQLLQTKSDLVKAEKALRNSGVTERELKVNPSTAVAAVAQLQAQITAQEIKIASMRGYVTEAAAEFKIAQAQLVELRAQIEKISRATQLPDANDSDYIAAYREFKYQEALFELFAKQFELAKVDESREGAVIQVLDVAQVPERKSGPRKIVVALMTSILVGLFLLGYVFVRDVFRARARDPLVSERLLQIKMALSSAKG